MYNDNDSNNSDNNNNLTSYNTVILVRSVKKVLDKNFLFMEMVQAYLDLILSRA